jgi:Deoxyinosine 3'endonuclease (endonuclease V)
VVFDYERAKRAQIELSKHVREVDEIEYPVRYAAGVDVSFKGSLAIGAAVVVEYPSLRVVEERIAFTKVEIPYVPTFLAFREVPPALRALKMLGTNYQVLFVDGNGRLHPRKAGFACHLGVLVDKPTIGVAKKLLLGVLRWVDESEAEVVVDGEVLGYAVKLSGKVFYVSVGHKLTLRTAVSLVKAFSRRGTSLPEPLRAAHSLSVRGRSSLA